MDEMRGNTSIMSNTGIDIVTLDGGRRRVDSGAVAALCAGLRGSLLAEGDPGYDDARRIWNAMIDKRPALVARCAGAADVMRAVRFAAEHGVLVSVKAGGHNVAGTAISDGGLVIDLSRMKSAWVDPEQKTVRAEPGLLWQELDAETQAFGMATTGGVVGETGISGLILGGGVGWLVRKHGMSCDNLLSADVVTADGRLRRASATDHPDLFWALRGGGGNFGVVTSFELRLHEVGPVLGGLIVHPRQAAADLIRFHRDFIERAPDELTSYVGLLTTPDGAPVVAMASCYCGDLAAGERAVAPMRAFGQPLVDDLRPRPYAEVQAMMGAGFPWDRRNYWKSSFLESSTGAAVDTIVEHAERMSPLSAIVLEYYGGAAARVPASATAFPHRASTANLLILGQWENAADDAAQIGWVRSLWEAMRPWSSAAVYMNTLGEGEGDGRVLDAYGSNYARLAAIKARYDPTNLFRSNQNVRPAAMAASR
jgi:FAD/FMN-containing dehydrogenase